MNTLTFEKDDWNFTPPGIRTTALGSFVAASVPLRMLAMQAKGGPSDLDIELARSYGEDVAAHGDDLLYGGKKRGDAAHLANGMAHAIAVLAFQPGGVRIFGYHFEAQGEVQP